MFEWDHAKNEANKKKHGVTFEDAVPTFEDPFALLYEDLDHEEQRWKMIGAAKHTLVLVVVYTYRHKIRIISARKATKQEKIKYEQQAY